MPAFQVSIFPLQLSQPGKHCRSISTSAKICVASTKSNQTQYFTCQLLHSSASSTRTGSPANHKSEHYLLQAFKCCLHSTDTHLSSIKSIDFGVQTNQLKIMVKDFLAFMQQQSRSMKTQRINCSLWILQQKPLLLLAFTLFFRPILSKLGLKDTVDYNKCVNSQATITSIIQYFDIHCRKSGELLLFYEDALFLTIFEQQILVGEYCENLRENEDTKKQLEIKSSVQADMAESVKVNVELKFPKVQGQYLTKICLQKLN